MAEANHLQVKTNLSELATVLHWFNQIYRQQLSRTILIQCQTILAEAFTNAVRHAHRGKPAETPIEILVRLYDDAITIEVWDFGPEFNLACQASNVKCCDPEAVSGRGIQLISRLSDCFSYQRTADQRNCLQVVKKFV